MSSEELHTECFTFGEHTLHVKCRKGLQRTSNFKLTVQVRREDLFNSLLDFGGTPWSSDEDEGRGESDELASSGEAEKDLDLLGLDIWPAAVTLGEYLASHPEIVRGKRVIELGAGVGLPGLVAGKVGAEQALITDYDADVVAHAHANAAECGLGDVCQGRIVDWKLPVPEEFREAFDVVLAADVMYMSFLVRDFVRTMAGCLKRDGGCVYLTHQTRQSLVNQGGDMVVVDRDVSFEKFVEEVEKHGGLAVEKISEMVAEGFPGPMYVLRITPEPGSEYSQQQGVARRL
jgi:predicted nicotinamide N-methyase